MYQKVGLAQMVERPLSMREVPGSISGFSNLTIVFLYVNAALYSLGTFVQKRVSSSLNVVFYE